MRIIFLNQFFPPDLAPTGRMVEVVAGRLVAEGHEVEVWCSGGSYGPSQDRGAANSPAPTPASPAGVSVVRIGKRGAGASAGAKAAGWLGFYLLLALRLLSRRGACDRLVALTTPPFLSVLARLAAVRHGAVHCHWIMDLYPDVLVAHGWMRDGGLAHRLLASLAKLGFGGRRVGPVLTLGPCMAERAGKLTTQPVSWVPLWGEAGDAPIPQPPEGAADEAGPFDHRRLRREHGWSDDEVVLLYSGNLGRGHLIAPLLDAALALHRQGVRKLRWVFTTHGPRSAEVTRFHHEHPDLPLEELLPVGPEILATHLLSADIHLASLEPAWCGCMVPSKIQGSFAVGRPVLFVGPAESSPARWIDASGGGWVVNGADPVAGLVELLGGGSLKHEAARRGVLAGEFAKCHFDRTTNSAAVAAILTGGSGLAAI